MQLDVLVTICGQPLRRSAKRIVRPSRSKASVEDKEMIDQAERLLEILARPISKRSTKQRTSITNPLIAGGDGAAVRSCMPHKRGKKRRLSTEEGDDFI